MVPFTSDQVEVIELGIVVAAGATGLRMLFCHTSGCYRLGRFRHGHYRVCRHHHPLVPSKGKITKDHIKGAA